MQNFIAVSPTVCTHVGRHKNFWGRWAPFPLWTGGVVDALETRTCPICITTPNFVTLGQTVWV